MKRSPKTRLECLVGAREQADGELGNTRGNTRVQYKGSWGPQVDTLIRTDDPIQTLESLNQATVPGGSLESAVAAAGLTLKNAIPSIPVSSAFACIIKSAC